MSAATTVNFGNASEVEEAEEAASGSGVGTGNPEGVRPAGMNAWFLDATGRIMYFKQSGTGNTGWIVAVAGL